MRYQPHTEREVQEMLQEMGLSSLEQLFEVIPEELRLTRDLDLPEPLDEASLVSHLGDLAKKNEASRLDASFLGAGVYDHYVPQVVDQTLLRSEFLTAYTPYQPELAQGTLKVIFQFQTMIAEILGMDIANASVYDGAHAVAEGLLMGLRLKRKAKKVLLSAGVHPESVSVTETHLANLGSTMQVVPLNDQGRTDLSQLDDEALQGVGILMVQSPNFFGVVEDLEPIAAFCKEKKILLGVSFSEPLAYGLFKPPGEVGADIAVGEGQSFGIAPGFGGPLLGILASKQSYLRNVPGRLVSRTVDEEGKDAFVLTLATREQHIRRARATSNICTNQGLMALAATIYLSLLGKEGYRELAKLNYARAEHVKKRLVELEGVSLTYPSTTFNEFTLTLPVPAGEVVKRCLEKGVLPGFDLGRVDEARDHQLLVATTERNTPAQIDQLVEAMKAALKG